jgi:hypothetical protein
MSPLKLKEINSRIFLRLRCGAVPRRRLLVYSLDQDFLTESEFTDILESRLSKEQVLEAPWAMAVFWGRLFYERGNGNNYRKIFEDCFGFEGVDVLFERIQKTCKWFPQDSRLLARNTYSFQAECWLTSSEGETSNLWKSLPRLIRKASLGGSEEEIWQRLDEIEDQDLPPPLRWLIKTRDSDFRKTLTWLSSGGNKEPIGELISQNPIHSKARTKDDFNACFGLRVARDNLEIALKVSSIWFGEHDSGNTREFCISQGSKKLFYGPIGKGSPAIILGECSFVSRFNVSMPVVIRLGNATRDSSDLLSLPWGGSSLLLFRQSDDSGFSRYIDCSHADQPPHIQGRYFCLAGRPGVTAPPDLLYGDRPVTMTYLGGVKNADLVRRIFQLDLQTLHDNVGDLCERGIDRPIAFIGRKAFLSFSPSASPWQIPGGDETPVFVGCSQLTVKVNNFPQSDVKISVRDDLGRNIETLSDPGDAMACILPIVDGAYGKKWNLVAELAGSGDQAKASILLLPKVDANCVSWLADDAGVESRYFTARNHGLEFGTISYPGGSTRVLRPIVNPQWAWSEGALGIQQDFCSCKEFLDHRAAASWWLDYALPIDGDWTLKFNDDAISSASGRKSLGDLLEERLDLSEIANDISGIDSIRFVNRSGAMPEIAVAKILRLPLHPVVGLIDAVPHIYIPSNFQSWDWRLVLMQESNVLDDRLTCIPLDIFEVGRVHSINELPKWKFSEGAWLVLVKLGTPALSFETFTEFAALLPFIEISTLCRVMPEREDQTFLMLLNIWHGDGQGLGEEVKQKVRTRLDLLENWALRANGDHAGKNLFARSRTQRHLLGHGSRDALISFFDNCILESLNQGADSFSSLLRLLLECGFNWVAEPDWVESLHGRVRRRLSPGSKFTTKLKDAFERACPLAIAFQKVHQGEVRDIHLIHRELFPQMYQPDIGLSIACPRSAVKIFKDGLSWRGFDNGCICVNAGLGRREIKWPRDFRSAVRIRDTYGGYWPIIIKVSNPVDTVSHFADRLIGNSSLRLDEETRDRIRTLFNDGLRSAALLVGDAQTIETDETQLGILFKACHSGLEESADEEQGQDCRAVIFQVAVLSRLNAWMNYGNAHRPGWSLDDPIHYDLVTQVISSIWDVPNDRGLLERDIALIEWLITWFKAPSFIQ